MQFKINLISKHNYHRDAECSTSGRTGIRCCVRSLSLGISSPWTSPCKVSPNTTQLELHWRQSWATQLALHWHQSLGAGQLVLGRGPCWGFLILKVRKICWVALTVIPFKYPVYQNHEVIYIIKNMCQCSRLKNAHHTIISYKYFVLSKVALCKVWFTSNLESHLKKCSWTKLLLITLALHVPILIWCRLWLCVSLCLIAVVAVVADVRDVRLVTACRVLLTGCTVYVGKPHVPDVTSLSFCDLRGGKICFVGNNLSILISFLRIFGWWYMKK